MAQTLTVGTESDREIVKAVREFLHLVPGGRVRVEALSDAVVFRREESDPMIFQENGNWVFSGGQPSDYSIPDLINEVRTERIRELGGE